MIIFNDDPVKLKKGGRLKSQILRRLLLYFMHYICDDFVCWYRIWR